MKQAKKPFELRNIKTNPSGYQVQFIIEGKSHSVLVKDLEKAKKIRDRMEKKFKLVPSRAFMSRSLKGKESLIPGTNKPMVTGVTLHSYQHQGSVSYSVIVKWKDHTGKKRSKTFYGCSETRYTRKVMKAAYDRALAFRKGYEQAIIDNTLDKFDPSIYNKKSANIA